MKVADLLRRAQACGTRIGYATSFESKRCGDALGSWSHAVPGNSSAFSKCAGMLSNASSRAANNMNSALHTTSYCLTKEEPPLGQERNPHNAEPTTIPGDTADVAPGYFKQKDDDSPYMDTPRVPGPEQRRAGPRGVLTGGGDLPPGYVETYEEVKPPAKPDIRTLRQQPDLPDFAGGGAPDPRVDRERAEGGRPIGMEDADYATGKHPKSHPAGHSGAGGGGAREAGMPLPMGATQAQATDLSADAEPERPLSEPVPAVQRKADPEDVFENYSRGNVKLGEAPADPRDTRTEQSR